MENALYHSRKARKRTSDGKERTPRSWKRTFDGKERTLRTWERTFDEKERTSSSRKRTCSERKRTFDLWLQGVRFSSRLSVFLKRGVRSFVSRVANQEANLSWKRANFKNWEANCSRKRANPKNWEANF